MTSNQIKNMPPAIMSANEWLKEIALQLALMNERNPSRAPSDVWVGREKPKAAK